LIGSVLDKTRNTQSLSHLCLTAATELLHCLNISNYFRSTFSQSLADLRQGCLLANVIPFLSDRILFEEL
jgi:hypothetical protein